MYESPIGRVSAKSLIIDLLSTMPPRHPVAVRALVRAAGLFAIGENSARVALARLRSRGLVESDKRGFYRLSRAALPVNREVRAWSTIDAGVCDWNGSYLGLDSSGLPRRDRKGGRARARALRLLGFEAFSPSMQLRPNNLTGGVDRCRERLAALDFFPVPVLFQLSDLDAGSEARARALWNVERLENQYATTRTLLSESAARLSTLSPDAAMAESFQIGGEAVRQIVLDPLLPAEIVDVQARAAMFDAMRNYDRLGRDHWRGWAGESIELERSPIDVRHFENHPAAG
jgi:phenylacetic acid degradation operon negative regulatory protein